MALRWCLSVLAELDIETIMVKYDSLVVINVVKNKTRKPGIDPIIQDCRMLASAFSSNSFSHANKRANN